METSSSNPREGFPGFEEMMRCTGVHVMSDLGGYGYTYKLTEPILCLHLNHKLALAHWNFEPLDLTSKQNISLGTCAASYCSIVLHGAPNEYFWKQLCICQTWLHNKVISTVHWIDWISGEFLDEFKKHFLFFFVKDNTMSCHNGAKNNQTT